MIWSADVHIFSRLLELIQTGRMSGHDKDLEMLVLSYQLSIDTRNLKRTSNSTASKKVILFYHFRAPEI